MKKLIYLITSITLVASLSGCTSTTNNSKTKDEDKQTVSNRNQPTEKVFSAADFKLKETDNFRIFYVEEDSESAAQIGDVLEKNYERIVQDFKPQEEGKFTVYIYPNLKEFHKATGVENAGDWFVGASVSKDKLFMVSPNHPGPEHTYEDIIYVAIHEFTHCVTKGMGDNINVPKWIGEGVAAYEADQVGKPDLNNLPSIAHLNANDNNDIYMYGYHIFNFIAKEYGKESIRALILNNGDTQKTFKLSEEQFEAKWKEYMKNRKK